MTGAVDPPLRVLSRRECSVCGQGAADRAPRSPGGSPADCRRAGPAPVARPASAPAEAANATALTASVAV